jgi:hypothetical protein
MLHIFFNRKSSKDDDKFPNVYQTVAIIHILLVQTRVRS